jgi:hypothetical protein
MDQSYQLSFKPLGTSGLRGEDEKNRVTGLHQLYDPEIQ